MLRAPERHKHIVNVSAMEGQFYRATKTDKHPHTNMAKAALNMMTRTSAPDFVKDGIHMNAVDTGWVTDEDPAVHVARKAELGFSPPLDIIDGAARILDPEGLQAGALVGADRARRVLRVVHRSGRSPAMKRISRAAALAAMLTASALTFAAEQKDAAKGGQAAYNNHCRTCHSAQAGDNRLGPTLHAIVGRKAGADKGYAAYSQALKSAGLTWDEATLDKFIADPEAVVRNNNMKPYKGIPDAGVRKQIVAYLKSIG